MRGSLVQSRQLKPYEAAAVPANQVHEWKLELRLQYGTRALGGLNVVYAIVCFTVAGFAVFLVLCCWPPRLKLEPRRLAKW